ncbi:unnamed protein product [Paramecium sonneborni]|uniref:PACRG-like protein n=1 Tax=Paramecium sonneborni TaxID=65129 RepID=A0A8S1PWX3_9CILI|nr:unnamed protein product [Paramecium sonneborni]
MQQQKKTQAPAVLNRTRSLGKQAQQKPQQQQQQQQIQQQPKQGFTQMPSQKLTSIKTVDPFSDKSKQKTNSFAYVYNAGGIPCRVNHGCNTMKLQWNQGVEIGHLPYDPLMVTCFEGLIEEAHPYCFIATNAIKDMLNEQNAQEKVIPILPKLVWPLRTALSSQNDKVFMSSLEILKLLSNNIGSHLNSHLKNLLVPLSKRMDRKNQKEIIQDVLRQIQENGGPDTLKLIKAAIPTYTNM